LKKGIIIGTILFSLFLVCLGGASYIGSQLKPVENETMNKEGTDIEISKKLSNKELAKQLAEKDVIKNETIFYYYLTFMGVEDVEPGLYNIPHLASSSDVAQILESGPVPEMIKVTIPEGYTVNQIAQLIDDKGLGDKDTFLQAVQEDYSHLPITQHIQEKVGSKYQLEGFLFPKTYEFKKGTTEKDIIEVLLNQTEKELKQEWIDTATKKGMEWYDVMTLASIVERETKVGAERNKVAGVYLNRLKIDMKLQADATIQYLFEEQKERVLYEDLKVESKYNTYLNKGLPPTPISNPGADAIEAVINAENHPYLFYVTRKDGSDEHYFSKTYQEHLTLIEKSKKNVQ
jgi:UPF0755 protein